MSRGVAKIILRCAEWLGRMGKGKSKKACIITSLEIRSSNNRGRN